MSAPPSGPAPLVLLTGASGFVGRHLALALVRQGWRVRAALRRPATDLPAEVEQAPLGDLGAPQDWPGLLAGADAVVHAAALAHAGPGLDDDLYDRVNRRAVLDLAGAAEGRVRRFVFISSIRAQCGPSSDHVLREDDPARPTDAYGRAKLAAEEGLARLSLSSVSLRPVVVYGEGVGGNVGLLLRLARTGLPLPLGGLKARRSLVAVENLCAAVDLCIRPGCRASGPLIVADPAPVTVAELVADMRGAMGMAPRLVPVPEGLLAAGLSLVGRREVWERLAGAMEADPARLLSLGWQPPAASTRDGVRRWLAPRGPRA